MTTERSIPADLDAMVTALRGGAATLAVKTKLAVPMVQGWRRELEASEDPRLGAIAADLGELEAQLTAPQVDRQVVGQLLSRLGERTAEVAPSDFAAEIKHYLDRLSTMLGRYGSTLSG